MEFYIEALELSGHVVVGSARNGAEAVEKFVKLPIRPDVIIMDHRMPIKDGIEATAEILKIDPKAKVIFASADYSVEPVAKKLGIVAFKKKPFSLDELISGIEEA
jgi:two-component system chemotaxis response regulator CheY